MSGPFYSVISSGKYGTYTFENDHVWKPLDEQLRAIAELVWSGEWDGVTACILVEPAFNACADAMRDLAEALDAISRERAEDPHSDTAELIRRVLGREPWFAPSEDEPEEYALPAVALRAKQTTHWGL